MLRTSSPRHLAPWCRCPRSRSALLAIAALAAVVGGLPAQAQFRLAERGWPGDYDNTLSVTTGDVDGDGDQDVLFGGDNGLRLYLNDGYGNFVDGTAQLPAVTGFAAYDLALGDVDGDNDLDLVIAVGRGVYWSYSLQNRLYLNNGAGVFVDATATQLPVDSDITTSLALGDVDGDGDLDVVFGNKTSWKYGSQNRLYLNNGTGTFVDATAQGMPPIYDQTNDVVFGDFDGDGDLDLLVANGFLYQGYYGSWSGEQNRLLLNQGGTFVDATATNLPVDNDFTRAVALGDIDGDGDLDLVFGNTDTLFQSAQNRLLRNNGGVFTDITASHFPITSDKTTSLAFADFDLDGDLDLVAGGEFWGGQSDRLYFNQGGGSFVDVSARLPVPFHSTRAIAIDDFDRDGDVDFVNAVAWTGSLSAQDRLHVNLLRQLDAPQPYQIGQTWTLDAYLRHGQASSSDFALPVLSLGLANVAVPPFGTLGIDPSLAFVLPLIAIPQPAGEGSLQLPVPVIPGLIGTPVYAQSLLLSSALPTHLSNVVADVYTPLPPPVIYSLSILMAGPGTPVTIQGANFLPGLTLTVGGVPTPIVAQTPSTIDFVMPATTGCDATVALANLGNSSASEVMNRTPVVTALSSAVGPAVGGATITIQGQYLTGATVTFNGAPMIITSQTGSAITGTTPAGAPGPGVILVTNAIGCVTAVPYTYDGTPIVGIVAPLVALPNTLVGISGNNFLPGLSITVGGFPATLISQTSTQVTFVMPAGNGCDTTLAVTNPGYPPVTRTMNGTPAVTLYPALYSSGPAAGGGTFLVAGSNLSSCTVTFNGAPLFIQGMSNGAITGFVPPGTPGPATVVIRNSVGCQTTLIYTYY